MISAFHRLASLPRSPLPMPTSDARAPRVIILCESALIGEALCKRVTASFPGAPRRHVARVPAAMHAFAARAVDIFVLHLELLDDDGLDPLRRSRACRVRTLVITDRAAPRVALSLRAMGVAAFHDALRAAGDELDSALTAVLSGRRCWNASFAVCLLGSEAHRIRHLVTPREQVAFALLATGLGEKSLAGPPRRHAVVRAFVEPGFARAPRGA